MLMLGIKKSMCIHRKKLPIIVAKRFKSVKAVSPVVATVLLIALSVLAGLIVTITVLTIITIPQSIQVTIEAPFDYKSTDSDVLVDTFRFGLRNDGDFALQILNPKANFKLKQNSAMLDSWTVDINSTFVVNERTMVILTFTTTNPQQQLKKGDKFQIVLQDAVVSLGASNENVVPSTVTSRTFTIGDTYGPLRVTVLVNNATHLQLNVTNLGTITLTIQLSITSATVTFTSDVNVGPIILDSGESTQPIWQHEVPSQEEGHILLLKIIDVVRGNLLVQKLITL